MTKKSINYKAIQRLMVLFLFIGTSIIGIAQNQTKSNITVLENTPNKMRVLIETKSIEKSIIKNENRVFTRIEVDGLGHTLNVGMPELPIYNAIINVPICDGFTTNVIKRNIETFDLNKDGSLLYPAQRSRSKNDISPFILDFNTQAYKNNEFWNPGDVNIEKAGIMRNTTLANLSICPFSYNPVSGKIIHVKSIEVEITFVNPNIKATNALFEKHNNLFSYSLQSFTLNPKTSTSKDSYTSGPLHYVIVSDTAFHNALQPLVNWKKKKGFIVTEAYTNNVAVGSTSTSIKSYLQGLYDNATASLPAPTYVLLVGDIAQIPSFTGTTGSHPTDLYYCDYTGDYLPEAYYGRFSATIEKEVSNQVAKTVEYEKYLMADPSFLNKVIMIAGQDGTYGPLHGDGQLNYVVNNYFVSPLTVYSYPFAISGSSASEADIIAKVSSGVAMANYTAHGGSDSWSDPHFSVSDVANLQNAGKYPLMMGNACVTNKFDVAVCFGEALLRAENKGAIGYIGASNNTTWDEDFWFTVGYRSQVTTTTTYDATKLGCYDRFFHTHNETFTSWYNTSGQMIQAGNLAVMMSNSSTKKYYWEIYHLMGDPSLMPYIGVPTINTASYIPVIPIGFTNISVTTTPYSYVAITMSGTLIGATFADATGIANVPLTNLTTAGTADIVITAQNKQPYFGTINVQTPSGAYVYLNAEEIVDPLGNNNNQIDFNETVDFNVALKNFGLATANNVQAKLTTSSSFITMTDSIETYGNIVTGTTVNKTNAFRFNVANNIPDGESVTFNLQITDSDSHTWNTTINKIINAPKFEINGYFVNDATGNNNNRIEPGETVQITISGKNIGHAIAPTTTGLLTTSALGVTITSPTQTIGSVDISNNANATFEVTFDNTIANPSIVKFDYVLSNGNYQNQMAIYFHIGIIAEDFETAGLTKHNWINNEGSQPWIISNTEPYEGIYCAKSGVISDGQNSILSITLNVLSNDSISFYRKVSSEATYDFLQFYIDSEIKEQWSGDMNWERANYPISAGIHTLKWIYTKDVGTSTGSDCAWIDYIVLPPYQVDYSACNINADLNRVLLYPNPTNSILNISYSLTCNQNVSIDIFDGNGRLIKKIIENKNQFEGTNNYTLNTNDMQSGLYYVSIKTNKSVSVQRFSVIK